MGSVCEGKGFGQYWLASRAGRQPGHRILGERGAARGWGGPGWAVAGEAV